MMLVHTSIDCGRLCMYCWMHVNGKRVSADMLLLTAFVLPASAMMNLLQCTLNIAIVYITLLAVPCNLQHSLHPDQQCDFDLMVCAETCPPCCWTCPVRCSVLLLQSCQWLLRLHSTCASVGMWSIWQTQWWPAFWPCRWAHEFDSLWWRAMLCVSGYAHVQMDICCARW